MAFPLTFTDEAGKKTRYWWRDYPVRVILPPREVEFFSPEPAPVTMTPLTIVEVFCGPPALLPAMPTADEFRDGITAWLSR